ncbi:unnamed protein product [Arabis nemorensis]|uniref:F-box domain-containing protein n=1 Tax=Arabis nemorensis TaxID=586526 RepID=A0A565AX00_9BRAS|nr:unnamed protein product [Arabis nemorensis]
MNPLPQDCIVEILPLTSPCDVCRSSAVSMIFKSAADSDDVWNQFLPSDLPDGFVAPDHEKFLVHHDSHLVNRFLPNPSSYSPKQLRF